MIFSFAFSVIGALLILANCRYFRSNKITAIGFILTAALAGFGIKFILKLPEDSDKTLFFPVFTPLLALLLMHFTQITYKRKNKKEIIFYIRGLFPVRQWERYVTRREITITFTIFLLSVLVPYIILILTL